MRHPMFKISMAALALTALTATASLALPPVSADDPLISLSYLTGSYRTSLLSDVDVAVAAAKKQLTADFAAQTAALKNPTVATPSEARNDFETHNLTSGQTAAVTAGGELLLVSGEATAATAGLVDATSGAPVAKGTVLLANHLYVASAGSTVESGASCQILIK